MAAVTIPTGPTLANSGNSNELPKLRKTCVVGGIGLKYKITPVTGSEGYIGAIKIANNTGLRLHRYHSVPIKWDGVAPSELNQLMNSGDIQITVVPKENAPLNKEKEVKNNFHISIKRLPHILPTSLPAQFTKEQLLQKNLHYIFFETAEDLVSAYKKTPDDEILQKIRNRMVDHFTRHHGRARAIKTMVALIPILDRESSQLVIEKLLKEIHKSSFIPTETLNGLADILRAFQISIYQSIIEKSKNESSIALPHVLDSKILVVIAQTLIKKLEENSGSLSKSEENRSKPDILIYLKVLITILEMLQMTEFRERKQELNISYIYNLFSSHEGTANLQEAFLANLGKNILTQMQEDQPKSSFLRHCLQFSTSLIQLYGISGLASPSLELLVEIGKSFYKSMHGPEERERWYVTIFSIEYALISNGVVFLQSFKYAIQWADFGQSEAKKMMKNFHTTNPFFLFGFLHILKKFINYQAGQTPEAYELAFFFLEKIGKDNKPNEEDVGIFTTEEPKGKIEKNYSKQIYSEVIELLKHYICNHPILSIRQLAHQVYQQIATNLEVLNPTSSPTSIPAVDELLITARKKVAPWCDGFKIEYECLLKDEQLEQEERFYIKAEAKNESGLVQDLNIFLKEFLNGSDIVMLLTGLAGSGKSLSIKHFVKASWQKGLPEGYIPIIVSLATFTDPLKAITETLNKRGIKIGDIKDLPILWIFDAMDEAEVSTNQRFYKLLELNVWPKAKVIFIARSGISQEKICSLYPTDSSRSGFTHLDMLPFDRKKIDQYFIQFSEIKKTEEFSENPMPLNAQDPKTYIKFLDENPSLLELISTPLYLSITAKVLPLIIKRRLNQEINQQEVKNEIFKVDLLDALYCSTIAREIHKKKCSSSGWEEKQDARLDYFNFALEVVKIFKDYEMRKKRAWIPKEEAEKEYPHLFNEHNAELVVKRKSCLITLCDSNYLESSQNALTYYYGYSHTTFYQYFFSLLDPTRAGTVKRLLKQKTYEQVV